MYIDHFTFPPNCVRPVTTDSLSHGSGRSQASLNASTQTYLRYWQLEQFLLDQERQKVDSNFEIACLKIGGGGGV